MSTISTLEAVALAAARRARELLFEHADTVVKTGLMQAGSVTNVKRPVAQPPQRLSRKREVEPASNDPRGGTKA